MTALLRRRAPVMGCAAIALLVLFAAGVWCGTGDQKPATAPPDDQGGAHVTVRTPNIHVAPLQVDVNMVVVTVTVTDPFDRIVTGLDQENFQVYDEKVEQKIIAFSTEDSPISVGMIFDSSGSRSEERRVGQEGRCPRS